MNDIQSYLHKISSDLNCDSSMKQELIDEMNDHLQLLKKEYQEKGVPDRIAEKCAIYDFGEREVIQSQLLNALSPFTKIIQMLQWIAFGIYILFLSITFFVGKFDILSATDNSITLAFKWNSQTFRNLIPFLNIDREIIQSVYWIHNRNAFDITFFSTALGNILTFIPFGLFLRIIFRLKSYKKLLLCTVTVGVLIEIIQLLSNTGALNVNEVLFYTSGSFIGWLIYTITRNLKEILKRKSNPSQFVTKSPFSGQ